MSAVSPTFLDRSDPRAWHQLNKLRTRAALAAVLALSAALGGFTVADLVGKVTAMTRHADYTVRLAAYDLRKLRGKSLVDKPGPSRRYHVAPAGLAPPSHAVRPPNARA